MKHPDPALPLADELADQPGARDVQVLRFHLTSASLSYAVVAVAVGALVGWWWSIPTLTSVVPGSTTMKVLIR